MPFIAASAVVAYAFDELDPPQSVLSVCYEIGLRKGLLVVRSSDDIPIADLVPASVLTIQLDPF